MDLKQFGLKMRFRAQSLEKNVDRVLKQASAAFLEEVILGTRVDTGLARSNWQVGLGAPVSSVRTAYAPGKGLGIDEVTNAQMALAAGLITIRARRRGQGIWISNEVDYIGYITKGPPNVIRDAKIRAELIIRNSRVL